METSFSKNSLETTLHDLTEAAVKDLQSLKDETKESQFVWEEKDVDRVTDELIEKLKSMYGPNGKIQYKIPTRTTEKSLHKITAFIKKNYNPESLKRNENPEELAKNIISSERWVEGIENQIYSALESNDSKNEIKTMLKNKLKWLEN